MICEQSEINVEHTVFYLQYVNSIEFQMGEHNLEKQQQWNKNKANQKLFAPIQ